MKILGIIPARYNSERFPGKPLADILGKTMIERVYEQATKAQTLNDVVVATDDERIAENVRSFGGDCILTDKNHKNGTERCAEVMREKGSDYSHAINIQGDEPLIHPEQIDELGRLLVEKQPELATLVRESSDMSEIESMDTVKVVPSATWRALYFSRSPVPAIRDSYGKSPTFLLHVGIYGYSKDALQKIVSFTESPLEKMEKLEQLRWLENDMDIYLAPTKHQSIGVDSKEDLQRVIQIIKSGEKY